MAALVCPVCLLLVVSSLALAAAQSSGYWRYDRVAECYSPQTCSATGRCLSSATTTPWGVCPANTYEIASGVKADVPISGTTYQGDCAWTGCYFGGCDAGWQEIASVSCGWFSPNKENCCRLRTFKTCRQWLACKATWITYTPVFAAGGAWSQTTPSATNAYIAARITDGVYTGDSSALDGRPNPDDVFANWFCAAMARAGARGCSVRVASGDTEYAVVNLGSSVLVVFRGTESITDVWTDIGLVQLLNWGSSIPAANAYGISGIALAYDGFVKNVLPIMAADLGPLATLPVWFAGHSLGGAYATIAAMYWSKQGKNVAGVYTYGTARAGTPEFATAYGTALGAKSFRHEHSFNGQTIDMVVGTSYGGLEHVGQLVRVDRYAATCAASSVGRRHHLRALLQAGNSSAVISAKPPPASLPALKGGATANSTAVAATPRYSTFDFTKDWLDPAVAYTTRGTTSNCTDTLSLCHSVTFYWKSLYTCLTAAQRTAIGEF